MTVQLSVVYLLRLFALGWYLCTRCFSQTKGSQTCSVHVRLCTSASVFVCYSIVPPSVSAVVAQAPVISVEPRVAGVRQGESVSFRCQVASGAQPVQLEWRKVSNQALPGQGEDLTNKSSISSSVKYQQKQKMNSVYIPQTMLRLVLMVLC